MNEIASLLWVPEGASQKDRLERTVRALELYESLAPGDGAEGMLAMQMVATHDAAMQCLKRAAASPQEFRIVDLSLKQAQKLMTLYTQQLATLDKHRGKGQQKVTVEHVNVQAGGQAIVGNVEAAASQRSGAHDPKVSAHSSEVPLDGSGSKAKQPADKRQGRMAGTHPRNTTAMRESPRCGAKTRKGTPCQSPAVAGKALCRMHGGAQGSGAPKGNKNALKHGLYTRESLEFQKHVQDLLREGKTGLDTD